MSQEDSVQKPFDSAPALATLKDFQRQTVEYVFERMYGSKGVDRFLVADEVGLGKTMVAKGIVAKVVEQLSKKPGHRIDIVYLCANRDIASQNIDRLNLFGEDRVSEANRLTLLPLHLHKLKHGPNFVAFTPGTALNLKGATGVASERALLYWIVCDVWSLGGASLRNFFQVGVGNDNWDWAINDVGGQLAKLKGGQIDEGVKARFKEELKKIEGLRERFDAALQKFQKRRDKPSNVPYEDRALRDGMIGEFRECLARACLNALEPDLIILDEFQRFSSLLESDKSDEGEEVAALGQQFLAYKDAKILLLSATPYKAYTLASEGDTENHHEGFLRTARFLLKEPERIAALKALLAAFSQGLFDSGPGGRERLGAAKRDLENCLRRHIVRTERLGVTADRDGMIEERLLPGCRLEPHDLEAFGSLDSVAHDLEQADVVEYWKSAPYLLNFMERDGYELKRSLIEKIEAGEKPKFKSADLRRVTLQAGAISRFEPIDSQNPRLRALVAEALDRGAWKILWIPATLPYYAAKDTAYDEALKQTLTKILVFSNWRFAPRAIAGMLSYETERRIAGLTKDAIPYEGLSTRNRRGLLRFPLEDNGAPRELNNLIPLFPSPALCEIVDPLDEAKACAGKGEVIDAEAIQRITKERIEEVLKGLPGGRSGVSEREDHRWYTAAMLQVEPKARLRSVFEWLDQRSGWASLVSAKEEGDGTAGGFSIHVEHFRKSSAALDRGKMPSDLATVLAKAALGSPAVTALRALRRLTKASGIAGYPVWLLDAAARIGIAFRGLFNQPDATVLTRALYRAEEDRYWEAVLDHCIAGNLQAVMDEHVHILRESVGVADKGPEEAVRKIAAEIVSALSMRATVLRVDDVRADPALRIMSKPIGFRCRSAVRFDTEASEDGEGETRADQVRVAFNSPFRPFVLATTAVGQEGLDFHLWCHAIFHWHLPANPADFEQREGRVHRYKGHVIRRSIGSALGLQSIAASEAGSDPWERLFDVARSSRAGGKTDLVPYWVYDGKGDFKIRRYIPALPLSREKAAAARLRASLGVYRMVFGQPRQEDLLAFLQSSRGISPEDSALFGIDLSPA